MVREPAVAGQFYSANKEGLIKQIEDSINSPYGPQNNDLKIDGNIIGAISPHAGFMFSGPAAAYIYKAIKENRDVDTFIILAPNHTGRGRTSLSKETYKTPLGEVEIDIELADRILRSTPLIEDNQAHIFEHSLEVQLPFIQYFFPKAKIVPIIISSLQKLDEIAKGIKDSVADTNSVIIASSDFTHYGFNFGYVPFEDNIRENIEKQDREAIKLIGQNDSERFLDFVMGKRVTICGYLPIAVVMKVLGNYKTRLLKYYTSSDISGSSDESSVSYASIIFI